MNSPRYTPKQIDKYRYASVEDNWSLFIESDFRRMMIGKGVAVDDIFYDLGASQGSGACFNGCVTNWGKYLLHLGYDNPILATAAEDWRVSWGKTGRYCHEHSVSFENDIWLGINPYDEVQDTLKFDMWANVMNTFDLFRLTVGIGEDLRNDMRCLYRELEREYEHLTSDESVSDWMQHNGIELTELEN